MADEKKAQEPIKPVETKVVQGKKETERNEILKKIADIVKEHGGLESNIPFNHDYWGLANRLRALNTQV